LPTTIGTTSVKLTLEADGNSLTFTAAANPQNATATNNHKINLFIVFLSQFVTALGHQHIAAFGQQPAIGHQA
jgi:hypothetical protein